MQEHSGQGEGIELRSVEGSEPGPGEQNQLRPGVWLDSRPGGGHDLKPGERLDDLQLKGLYIIQNPRAFCFGIDAVLLSDFASRDPLRGIPPGAKVVDFGTGTGIIPLLIWAKTGAAAIKALEIQPDMARMAQRSVRLNGLESAIEILEGDIREASVLLGRGTMNAVLCNPPYMANHKGLLNSMEPKALARHELMLSFRELCREAAAVLKDKGAFYLIHRPSRLVELFSTLTEYRLEPKRLRMVHPFPDQDANLVLIEARKGGGGQLDTLPPLIVYREKGVYTEEIGLIYGDNRH